MHRIVKTTLLVFSFVILFQSMVLADPIETEIVSMGFACIPKGGPTPSKLASLHNSGKWEDLQKQTCNLFSEIEKEAGVVEQAKAEEIKLACETTNVHAGTTGKVDYDLSKNYYSMVLLSSGAFGKDRILRFLAHKGIDPYESTLPGLSEDNKKGSLRQIFLTNGSQILSSTFDFVEEEDVEGQKELVEFVSGVLKAFIAAGGPGFLRVQRETKQECETVYAIETKISIKKDRGSLQIADTMAPVPTGATHLKIAKKAEFLTTRYGSLSPYVDEISQTITGEAQDELKLCLSQEIAEWSCWGRLKSKTETTVQDFLIANPTLPKQDLEAVLKVESEFLDLFSAGSEKTEASWTYKNIPWKRYSFGLLAGAIIKDWENTEKSPRAKLDEGKLVPDPLPNQLTMTIMNWHVKPYDALSEKMSSSERFSPFIGATLTPEFGIGGGLTVKLLRNVSVNLGLAAMVVDVPRDVTQLKEDASADDLKTGWGRVAFLGVSYSFE